MPVALIEAFRAACAPAARLRMAARGVLVVACDTAAWRPWRTGAEALLDAAERARVQGLRDDGHRADRAIAYALHRLLVAEVLDVEPARVPLDRDARGCPRVRGETLSTSLSHGDAWIAMGLSWAGPVGVDIEADARAAAMPEIRDALLHPCDVEARDASDPCALLALWTRKEAVLKAAGTGLEIAMTEFAAPPGTDLPLPAGDGRCIRVTPLFLPGQVVAVAHVPGPLPLLLELQPPVPQHRGTPVGVGTEVSQDACPLPSVDAPFGDRGQRGGKQSTGDA